ncbi:MAG: metallophosphoesterase [Actinobacteria bacterium]|nr:metallophosphoesterase [Actinomycetota bacterium]
MFSRKKKKSGSSLKVFFATDIHGSDVCFRKFLNAGEFYGADLLLLGGDICGKWVTPYWRESDGWTIRAGREPVTGLDDAGLAEVRAQVRDAGGYPHELSPEEVAELDEERLAALFDELAYKCVSEWVELADERLRGKGVRCMISPGNDDPEAIDALLDAGEIVENPEGRAAPIGGGWEVVSCGIANRTPWDSPREADEPELEARLRALVAECADPTRTVCNFHVPPQGTALDVAPLLDENLKPVVKAGEMVTTHVGSSAVRTVIEEFQPALGLHGHVHESRATCRLGESLCLNPGSEYSSGSLMGGLVELDADGGVRSQQLTIG